MLHNPFKTDLTTWMLITVILNITRWHADVKQWHRLSPFCATCMSPLFRIWKKKSSQRRGYSHQM